MVIFIHIKIFIIKIVLTIYGGCPYSWKHQVFFISVCGASVCMSVQFSASHLPGKRFVVNSADSRHRFTLVSRVARVRRATFNSSLRFRRRGRPSRVIHAFPLVYRRDLFSYIEEINDEPITSHSLSLLLSSLFAIGKPLVVSHPIHMRGPYVCNRVVNSEHGPRVPVPIQVVSSASRRTHLSSSSFCFPFSSSASLPYSRAWILFRAIFLVSARIYGRISHP